ncbi:MAG: hypothetical protein R3231_09680 [bacterium]|nr:hypothetical protein [bacterium]
MQKPDAKRQIRNVMEYSNGLVVCLDQNCKRIDDYSGPKDSVLPALLDKDLSKARIKRKVQSGKGLFFEWKFITIDEFFDDFRKADPE